MVSSPDQLRSALRSGGGERHSPVHRSRAERDAAFFARLSSLGETWRLFPEFAGECVFLDIETTGLSTVFDTVTMVGLFDGTAMRCSSTAGTSRTYLII